ncbi:MAG TPA: hypothetical protein VI094_10020 [Propionibacteriaceae bacterium]
MRTLQLSTVAALCALGTVVCFVVGAVAMASSGLGVLIPETGRPGRDWIAAVDAAGGLFFVGAWLVILMGFGARTDASASALTASAIRAVWDEAIAAP